MYECNQKLLQVLLVLFSLELLAGLGLNGYISYTLQGQYTVLAYKFHIYLLTQSEDLTEASRLYGSQSCPLCVELLGSRTGI